mmetsp:Transcript_12766/g.27985  ORF Transcript_12766/g.27985 Transcript_12766/m.27985 type:complete len:255 (-) Transcript_12766:14-778(-)
MFRELTFTSVIMPAKFNPSDYWYNQPLWFVNVMGWFWIFEEASYALVVALWRTGYPITAMSTVFVLYNGLWSLINVIPKYIEGFPYVDVLPFRFFHQYWAGIMLAIIVKERMANKVQPTKWMATVGVCLFLCLYLVDPTSWDLRTESILKRYGWSTPLMCLIIMGLAEGADPLAKVCANPQLFFFGDLAFAFYAMQATVWAPIRFLPKPLDIIPYHVRYVALFPILLGVAYVVNRYWQIPIRRRIEEWGKTLPT